MPDDCRCACPPRPPRGWALALVLAGSAAPGLAEPPPELALPPVPEALIAEAPATRPAPGRTTPAPPSRLELGPMTVTVTPGVNVLAEIAIDQLNRILTPFPNPQVRTVSEASTQVDGPAVYLATATETPVTLFISDAAYPNQALSLTLAPGASRHGSCVWYSASPWRPRSQARPRLPHRGRMRRRRSNVSSRRCAPWPRRRCPMATVCVRRGVTRRSSVARTD
ncbi:MAG: hypothetical protein MZU95_16305 [Desulfomicrobium escambiense]|nr:hypothetical protein [Desulfomicrobium escambiense]